MIAFTVLLLVLSHLWITQGIRFHSSLLSTLALGVSKSENGQESSNPDHPTSDEESQAKAPKKKALNIGILTWNLAEKCPTDHDCSFLQEHFKQCDIIALGLQEMEDIRPRRAEGHRTRKWREIQKKYFPKSKYNCLSLHKLGGMQLSIIANKRARKLIEQIHTMEVACGIGNIMSNKGAICTTLRIRGKSYGFINAHLAAHEKQIEARNNDYKRIVNAIDRKLPESFRKVEFKVVKSKPGENQPNTENQSTKTKKSKSKLNQVNNTLLIVINIL